MSEHTPGIWMNDDTRIHYTGDVIRHNGVIVCQMRKRITMPESQYKANARLIAASPEMYALLHRLDDCDLSALNEIDALLAKIEGSDYAGKFKAEAPE